tara:strand:+ start:2506 stop:3117 length:612 start_codon:yes stop_codon:yes gene_type:complete
MSIENIQKLWRGYNTRNKLSSSTDNMSHELLMELLKKYNDNLVFTENFNKLLSKKKVRNENFPSHISENIAKFAIFKKYKIMPCWDTDKGDIIISKLNLFKQIEVKGFMSDGPSSFGPTENWDWIYFVDARDTRNSQFKVYEIKLSNTSEVFRSIKLNKKETYGEIADNNQRGKLRGCFEKIFKPQLENNCNLIFDGHISQLC